MATWSMVEAERRFPAIVSAARSEAQTVEQDGKPAVVIVDAAEYRRLRQLARYEGLDFGDMLLAIPQDGTEGAAEADDGADDGADADRNAVILRRIDL